MTATTKQQGFSLLEILIVVGILSILLGIGALNVNQYIQRSRLDEASKVMGETLRRVSELAITESQKFEVSIGSDTISWKETATNTPRGSQELPYNAVISAKSSSTFSFSGRGIPVDPENFTVSLNSKHKEVYLFVTGAVSYQ
jgi:prepilin-type N-terminal cleavage/methylation domain-containing protein